ncbi:MAG: cytochrome-c oxidase, cbb3-type subunit III [Betaproteobacteria bacterium RBG_16_64_9]|nr:MAG: cytochrome-c oxidase, cbb3-type subunit III [Betaproteobacteria bacterium RBG_16_64_9]
MSDFTGPFWAYYVAIITLAGIVACGVLLWAMSARRTPGAKPETTGHVWDEDLGEYNHPLPRWWMWLFYLTIVFSLVYLALYPGLGIYEGALQWSSTGEHQADVKRAEEQYGPLYAKYAALDLKELAKDPEARAMGQRLFLNNCAQCHASDAGGSRGFPNLADRDWLWGGEPELIKASIMNGRNSVMPAFGPVLGAEGSKDVAHFIMSFSGRPADSIRVARGKEKFAANCVACHGPEGKGNILMGAPNLTDEFWLHGASEAFLIETITKGRRNTMPANKDFLSEAKIHLLAAYVYGLSNGQ